MKKKLFIVGLILATIAEIIALTVFSLRTPELLQDTVAVNEAVQSVARDFDSLSSHETVTGLDYTVLDCDGNLLYSTKAGLSESVNSAIAHRDTILDIKKDGVTVGKIIVSNDGALSLQSQKRATVTVMAVAIALNCAICCGYFAFTHFTVIRPFRKLKGFAERVADGNLEVPLEMDRHNIFGAFTESFDIMRSELKKARVAEAQANASKKELVAKLSHDIKTPVASIKAVSEVGLAVTDNERDRGNYAQIIGKADQINSLVTNLFTATLEELRQLTVQPEIIASDRVRAMLQNADYLKRAEFEDIPQCLVYADALRLQQVFDNIFSNSYKYAKSEMRVSAHVAEGFLNVVIGDFGGGVPAEELSVLKEKFRRGSNAVNEDGAGLGLYISDYFMKEMQGGLEIRNGARGLEVTVSLRLSGNPHAPSF